MEKKILTLLLTFGSAVSGNAFAQGTAPLDELMKCSGWSERALKYGQYFLENFMSEGLEKENKKYRIELQAFNKAFKEKPNPTAEDWDNDITYTPIDKKNSIFEEVTFYNNYGMGFKYIAKLKPTVNITQLKSSLETRDQFKFKNYSKRHLDQYAMTKELAANDQTSDQRSAQLYSAIKLNYPWLGMIIDEHSKANTVYAFGKKIKDNPDISTYIGIEQHLGKTPVHYLVCGVNPYQS